MPDDVRAVVGGAVVSAITTVACVIAGFRYGHPWVGGLLGFFVVGPTAGAVAYLAMGGTTAPTLTDNPQIVRPST